MEYRYTLKYKDGTGNIVISDFPADIDVNRLRGYLRRFFLACSWLPETLNKLLGEQRDNEY